MSVHGYSLLRTQLNNDYFHDLFNESLKFDVPIEGHRNAFCFYLIAGFSLPSVDTETGPGVLETALAYTTALRMADNAILFKYMAKSVGMKYGVIPSFMAKPWGGVGFLSFSELSVFELTQSFPSSLDVAGKYEDLCII